MSEFGIDVDQKVGSLLADYGERLESFFKINLQLITTKDDLTIKREVNYLVLAIGGLGLAAKVQDNTAIEDYIEMTFNNL